MTTDNQGQLKHKTGNLVVKKSIIWTLLSVIIYKIILDLSYYFVILPVWGYAGLKLNSSILKFIESLFLLLIILFFRNI